MARRYARDARGRFASSGYQGQTSGRGSRLRSPGKTAGKGSTTRAAAPAGTIGKTRRPAAAPRNGIRSAGGLSRGPANAVRPTSRRAANQPPLGLKANAVRAFNPKSPGLQRGQAQRQIDRFIGLARSEMQGIRDSASGIKKRSNALMRKMALRQARAFAQRNQKGITGDIARSAIQYGGGRLNRAAQKVIQQRMQRAAAAASRGSKPARRARELYANQLAFTGSGKPKAAKSNIRPGPRNTQGPPKRKRRRRR